MIKFRYFIICTKIYHFSCHSIDRWRCISVAWKSFIYIDGVNKDFSQWCWLEDAGKVFFIYALKHFSASTFETTLFPRCHSLPFVLLFANSKRMVWGMSGSNRTPCCNLLALYSTFYMSFKEYLNKYFWRAWSSLKNLKHLI